MIANFSTAIPISAVPDSLVEFEIALKYWEYLKFRFKSYGEVLTAEVIAAQLAWLAAEPDPKAVLIHTLAHGNKSLRPIDNYGHEQYKLIPSGERYAVRASRASRTDKTKPISDTVMAPRSQFKFGKGRPAAHL